MKILYVSASTVPSYDANSINVMNMCHSFSSLGYDVKLIATKGELLNDVYAHYGLKVDKKFSFILSKKNRYSFLYRILNLIKHFRWADLIYTRWIIAGFISSVILRRKTVIEYHSCSNRTINKIFNYMIVKFGKVERLIFITDALLHSFQLRYKDISSRSIVLSGGANVNEEDFLEEKEITCGYIGSFKEGKGVDTIVKIALNLPNVKFHIIGGNKKDIDNIKENIGNPKNVIWHGYVSHSDVNKSMNLFQIALLPNKLKVIVSKEDIGMVTSPNKMFEYMSSKKAIIASDIEVLKEVLINGENSLLVSPENVADWVKAIRRLIENAELRQTISNQAFKAIEEKYSWNIRARKAIEGINL